MRIVILDSCSSGAITRAKGGVKTQPFLFDSSVSAEGYAFLTSSSADETSQESDSIESSYFTHSILAGLRGAADSVGDGRVTLNELYRFAYSETLAKTETSMYGAQHPSYDIQISGSGDVVLTDIKEISASLLIAEDIIGRISIRDSSDFLVAELTKITRKPMELGLEPGLYRITLQRGDSFFRAEITLTENKRTTLGTGDLSMIAGSSGDRSRGDSLGVEAPSQYGDEDDNVPVYPFNLQFLPGMDVFGHGQEKATNNILLGLFAAMGHNINGVGAAPLGLMNTGYVRGIQASSLFTMADGPVSGVQSAGIFNYAGDTFEGVQSAGIFNYIGSDIQGVQGSGIFNYVGGNVNKGLQGSGIFNYVAGSAHGLQAAGIFSYTGTEFQGLQASGIFNWTGGELHGVQASVVNINGGGHGAMFGLVNVSKSEDIVPFGLVNVMKNGILHPAVYFDDMLFTNISFRSGSKWFYTILSTGVGGGIISGSGDNLFVSRFGFGFEFTVNKFFVDIDMIGGSIVNIGTTGTIFYNEDDMGSVTGIYQVRLTAGYKVFEHLGVFAGLSYDYLYREKTTCPDVRDFGSPIIGGVFGPNTHKLGFFGGIQF